jgi:hypothetical protein
VLAKATRLRNLQVSVEIHDVLQLDTIRHRENMSDKVKLVIGPLHRLRCIPKPRLIGIHRQFGSRRRVSRREHLLVEEAGLPHKLPNDFDALAKEWEHCVAAEAPFRILPKSTMYKLFVEFKALHGKLVTVVPYMALSGPRLLLHPARVAREQEDIVAFRKQFVRLISVPGTLIPHDGLRREVESAAQRMTEMMAQLDTSTPMLNHTRNDLTDFRTYTDERIQPVRSERDKGNRTARDRCVGCKLEGYPRCPARLRRTMEL